jgi:hypothetical protein
VKVSRVYSWLKEHRRRQDQIRQAAAEDRAQSTGDEDDDLEQPELG